MPLFDEKLGAERRAQTLKTFEDIGNAVKQAVTDPKTLLSGAYNMGFFPFSQLGNTEGVTDNTLGIIAPKKPGLFDAHMEEAADKLRSIDQQFAAITGRQPSLWEKLKSTLTDESGSVGKKDKIKGVYYRHTMDGEPVFGTDLGTPVPQEPNYRKGPNKGLAEYRALGAYPDQTLYDKAGKIITRSEESDLTPVVIGHDMGDYTALVPEYSLVNKRYVWGNLKKRMAEAAAVKNTESPMLDFAYSQDRAQNRPTLNDILKDIWSGVDKKKDK